MVRMLLVVAAAMQTLAVAYALFLLTRRRGATAAWLCLLGGMLSMLAWRLFMVSGYAVPAYFNPLIAIWGSTFMLAAMFLFGREVSARRRAEAERDALLDSERAARMQAESASRAKDEFLATLSHELRSPLSAILGWCEVVKRTRDSPQATERGLEVVERNARAQARLVDDLLDVMRMRAGSLHLETERLALDVPVRAAVQAAMPMAAARNVALDLHVEGGHAPTVVGDPDRLQQIVTNLVVNAVKFTPPAGSVDVTVRTAGDHAELVVTDTGIGIDPAFLPQVFARFRQADSSVTRRHGGLGLGLSIVEHLVEMHGGAVRAESPGLGRGATFTVSLPLAPHVETPLVDAGRHASPAAGPAPPQDLRDVRVLIVDDEDDVRSAVVHLLEQHGAQVAALPSGAAIQEALREHRPHVLLFDIGMPGEDGYSLVRRVRSLPSASGGMTPAISLTAHARTEDRARALAAGFDDHLPKPLDVPRLVRVIAELSRRAP